MPLHRTRLSLGLGICVLALALTGCGTDPGATPRAAGSGETQAAGPRTHSPRSRAAAPHPSPSASAGGSSVPVAAASESPTAESSPAVARTATERLLTTEELPRLAGRSSWEEVATRRSEGDQPFGTCHKFAMTSIGAMRVVVRHYAEGRGEDTVTAGHLVADFADDRTARRAFEVLKSWRGQCEEELEDYERRDLGGFQAVTAPGAEAGWYLLSYGPTPEGTPDEGFFDAQGITRVGRRVAALAIRVVGQDYDYPPGKEPMVDAVRKASAKLG